LEGEQHAAEVLADELDDQTRARQGLRLRRVLELQDLVEEVGAPFKGELFGQDERVIAVEEEGGDLRVLVSVNQLLGGDGLTLAIFAVVSDGRGNELGKFASG
jgi:hypothetical protein